MDKATPTKKRQTTHASTPELGRAASPSASSPQTPSTKAKLKIPSSIREAAPEDKMLIAWKENNKSYTEIATEWKKITGIDVRAKYLSNRYWKIKSSMVRFTAEDDDRLLRAKRKVELEFEHEKWQLISKTIEELGGAKYPATACQKRAKQLFKGDLKSASKDNENSDDE